MCIFARKGVYYARFTVNGKEIVKSTRTRDKKLAKVIEEDFQREALKKGYKTMLLSEAIDRCYEEHWYETKKGEETYNRAQALLEYLGDIPLNEITNDAVQKMRKTLIESGRTAATINRHMSRLKVILKMAHERWRTLEHMPYIGQSKEIAGRIRVITQHEEALLLDTLSAWGEKDIAAFFIVLLDTGMRLSEALNLKAQDVSMTKNLIHVWETKTDNPRSIPMTKRVRGIIGARLSKEVLFETLTFNKVEYVWNKVRCALAINDDDFVIHALRHTYASRLVEAGYDLYKVKLLLGHRSIKVTERYAHLLPTSILNAGEVLEKFNGIYKS